MDDKKRVTITKAKVCEDYCPKCGSEDIDWGQKEIGDILSQSATCNTCGCKFIEYYAYSETNWQE